MEMRNVWSSDNIETTSANPQEDQTDDNRARLSIWYSRDKDTGISLMEVDIYLLNAFPLPLDF